MTKLAVFASGRGSNFRAIVDHVRMGILQNVEVTLLVTNDASAPAAAFAKENSIPSLFIQGIMGRKFASKDDREKARNEFDEQALNVLNQYGIDLVVLAGFMQVLGPVLVHDYRWRIMNIHPCEGSGKIRRARNVRGTCSRRCHTSKRERIRLHHTLCG